MHDKGPIGLSFKNITTIKAKVKGPNAHAVPAPELDCPGSILGSNA